MARVQASLRRVVEVQERDGAWVDILECGHEVPHEGPWEQPGLVVGLVFGHRCYACPPERHRRGLANVRKPVLLPWKPEEK